MKAKEIREKSSQELNNLLKELRLKLTKMRFDASAKQLKNYKGIALVRKEIARILTILNQSK